MIVPCAPDTGRDRRRRPGRPDAGASAASARHRFGDPREPQPRLRDRSRSRRRARAGHCRSDDRNRRRRPPAREGMRHGGVYIAFNGRRHQIDMAGLTGGRAITIYGQNEVVKDLIDARTATGSPAAIRSARTSSRPGLPARPAVRYVRRRRTPRGDVRFHRRLRRFPRRLPRRHPGLISEIYEREYPFGWLGILANAPPSSDELVYSNHPRGFALFSMRSLAGDAALSPVRAGRGPRRAGPTIASGPSCRRDSRRPTDGGPTRARFFRRA